MTAPTNTRRTRKAATAPVTAPVTAPDATTDTTTPDESPTPDTATDAADTVTPVPTPAYVIPAWSADADQAAYVADVATAYRDADKTVKASMRSAWSKFQSVALDALDIPKLTLARDVNAVLKTTKATVEVDPADAYLVRIGALRLAADALSDAFRVEHGDEAADALTARMHSLTDGEVTAIEGMRDKLAVVPSNRRTGPQRSVEAHIMSALEAAPAGTILTCAQIHNHRSDAYGPDDSPSVGAVGAAHGREMDGIESTENDAKVKGFKLA